MLEAQLKIIPDSILFSKPEETREEFPSIFTNPYTIELYRRGLARGDAVIGFCLPSPEYSYRDVEWLLKTRPGYVYSIESHANILRHALDAVLKGDEDKVKVSTTF